MKKILAVFMTVMMLISTFTGIISTSAAEDESTDEEHTNVWETVKNVSFENNSTAPAGSMNIWGKTPLNTNVDALNRFTTWSDAGISKPNSTEDFGAGLIIADSSTKVNAVTGLYEGRLNDFADFTLEKGVKYRYSIWAYLANTTENGESDTAKMTVKSYAGTNTSAASKTFVLTKGQWQKLELEYTVADADDGKTSGFRFSFGKAVDSETTNYPIAIYFDNARIEKYVGKSIPNIGDNWKTLDAIDFEDGRALKDTPNSGKTINGRSYTITPLNGGNAGIKVASAIKSEREAGIGTSSNLVYEFDKTEGANLPQGMIRLVNYFDLSDVSVGDILRIGLKVYPTGVTLPEGVTNDATVVIRGHYSVSGKYGSSNAAKNSDSIGIRYLVPDQWTELGLTTIVTQEMIDAGTTGLRFEHISGDAAIAKKLYFDDIKVEVYQDKPAADRLYVVQNFDYEQALADITLASASQNAPYTGMRFTRLDNGATYSRFNLFGTGTAGAKVAAVANAKDHSGIIAHSGTNAVKVSGRWSGNGGVKVEDIFMGRFDKDDIGKKITVSAWIYADKSAGAYKLKWDEEKQGYTENSAKADAVKYTDEELANLEKTMVAISFAGPNDAHYSYRTGTVNTKKYEINWNEWTKISTSITITEAYLDNGASPTDTVKNKLISAIRIDQAGATGLEDQAVIDTFYIDDIIVEEKMFEVSAAIGDHMVYQKGRPIRVWGTNQDIGETVTVKFNGVTKTSVTDKNGNWITEFDKIDEYTRGLSIDIKCPGEDDITFTDVSIGEVILASGQSNMEFNLSKVCEAEDILADVKTNDNISILSFESSSVNRGSYDVLKSPKGAYWSKKDLSAAEICSGVGYITAYNIAKKYDIPVAILDANLGGSNIIAWLPQEAITARKDDVYKSIYNEMINKSSTVSSGSIWMRVPAGMFNALLAPLDNYEIGIMLWYQGCANASAPLAYNYYQYDLINSWRQHFGAEDTPFVICQLAPYHGSHMGLRQVQFDTAKRMDNVYLAITADLGPVGSEDKESKLYYEMTPNNSIHPVRKIPVADRISKILYANYFGENMTYTSPEYTKMEVKDNYAILHFKNVGTGIVKSDETKDITGFEVSADGSTFVKATAEILPDNTIKVYAEGVDNIVEVRYCWVPWVVPDDALTSEDGVKLGDTLGGNLTNETGIPMGPFRATLPASTIFATNTETTTEETTFSIAVRNQGYSEVNPRLMIALYNGNSLVNLKSEILNFNTIDTKTVDITFPTSDINDDTTIKAFLWNDMGSMIPLRGVYPIERK